MNKIVLYAAGAIFLIGLICRILAAAFFPNRFAQGARKALFLDEREKALFRTENCDKDSNFFPDDWDDKK